MSDLNTKHAPIEDRHRLESIWENGLCREWLAEMDDPPTTFEKFLTEIDGQVEMDRWETSEEGIATLRAALAEPMTHVLTTNGGMIPIAEFEKMEAGE